MARPASLMKQTRTRHSQAYKDEALAGRANRRQQGCRTARPACFPALRLAEQEATDPDQQRARAIAGRRERPTQAATGRASRGAGHGKKGRRVLCQEPQVKYAFMRTQAAHFSIQAMCRVLGVARSGYYAWCSRRTSMRHQRRAELDRQVAQAYNARKGRSGAPRLCHDLREAGLPCNRKTVAASMQRQGLRAKTAKKFKATTNSQHSLPVAENRKRSINPIFN